jgi:magnesium transporter
MNDTDPRTRRDEPVSGREDADDGTLALQVAEALTAGDRDGARRIASEMKAPDLADVIEMLAPDQRVQLVEVLGQSFDYEVLSELDSSVRNQLIAALPQDVIVRALSELETDDAAYLIEGLEPDVAREILAQLSTADRAAVERNLEYPEETAGRLMQGDFVAIPPFWTVGHVIDYMRESTDLPESFSDIFVVDPTYRVLGSVDLSRLLRTKRNIAISDIMDADRHLVLATEDQEQVARQFERYDLKSAPVVDANQRLVGVVTVDDVVEVIQEEAEEDLRLLAGVGTERISDSIRTVAPARLAWLSVNLLTALVAASVIKTFDATISQMVTLAVLMPIVASMGGNAGTQTMTVTVRALATQELGAPNVVRVVLRETIVGLINGLVFATVLGTLVVLWFGSSGLGLVISSAMIINLMVAALVGIFVPLILDRFDFDPAVASSVFVTTVTDVVGFFAFLGLASVWLR